MKNYFLIICWLICTIGISAQNITAPLHSFDEYTFQRLAILNPDNSIHSAIRPYRRDVMVQQGLKYLKDVSFSEMTKFDIHHLLIQNNEFVDSSAFVSKKPILKHFYKTPAHFFEIKTKDFYLKADPIINIGLGKSVDDEGLLFINQRGVEIRGGIDDKIYFSTQILESQVRFPNFINEFTKEKKAVPGVGLYKLYDLDAFNVINGRDFLLSQAYVGFNISKHIGGQFGHGTNFIGDGFRSLLLSDHSTPYFYLKLNTRVWKFHYQNIFTELAAAGSRDDNGEKRLPRKYMAGHYLSYHVRPNLTLGIYEAVIFAREKNRFELQYLNPIIFYRTVEGAIGSPDNALLGATINWNLYNSISLYGQFMLDDVVIRNVFNGNLGWWGNKWGIQAGVKYLNALEIEHLDVQVELNSVRPYTYSHFDSTSTYSNFNQALAHPIGANFNEILFSVNYRPMDKLHLKAKLFLIKSGDDIGEISFGQNILRPNRFREKDFGNTIGQGDASDIRFLHLSAAYELRHNLFLEVIYGNRDKVTESGAGDLKTSFFTGTVRWNFNQQPIIF